MPGTASWQEIVHALADGEPSERVFELVLCTAMAAAAADGAWIEVPRLGEDGGVEVVARAGQGLLPAQVRDARRTLVQPLPGAAGGALVLLRGADADADEFAAGDVAQELSGLAGLAALMLERLWQTRERERLETELRRRTKQEIAFKQATVAVSESFRIDDVVFRIAEAAARATDADGALVVRVDVDPGQLVVASAAGEFTYLLGRRAPYRGSLSQRVLRQNAPLPVSRLGGLGIPLLGQLDRTHADWCCIVVPLSEGGEEIGVLAVMRAPGKSNFTVDDVRSAHTFGYLASLAFRKIHLLEDSERKRQELERMMASRERLLRGFSHDVKNPLGAADGYAQLFEDGVLGELTPGQQQSMVRLRRSLRSALRLIDDVLDLARAEAGEITVRSVPVDLLEVTREMVAEYEAQADASGISISIDLPGELPVIRTDAARVRQILGNLLSNIVKYARRGGRAGARIALRSGRPDKAAPERDWVVVEIWDTGPGIPPSQQAEIFREFTRLEPGRAGGVGIGLAISRLLARALGGELTLASAVGVGSTFTLWLPLELP